MHGGRILVYSLEYQLTFLQFTHFTGQYYVRRVTITCFLFVTSFTNIYFYGAQISCYLKHFSLLSDCFYYVYFLVCPQCHRAHNFFRGTHNLPCQAGHSWVLTQDWKAMIKVKLYPSTLREKTFSLIYNLFPHS